MGELMKGFLLKRELPDEEKEKFRNLEGERPYPVGCSREFPLFPLTAIRL
ncbi:MAG: hypothetical protein ACLRMZ_17780 [Blautia marasmi]